MMISGTDLVQWAATVAASADLPALIRRLILATSDAQVSMRAGDGVRLSGFDGLVEHTEAHNFIPHGPSVWEMGVNADVAAKAKADYGTRTADPLSAVPAQTTFVFVTPRRWSGKETWAKAMRKTGVWRDVRVLDADDLEGWLSVAPAVEVWLAPRLRLSTLGTMSIERYWDDWAAVTTPRLQPAVVTTGWSDHPEAKLRTFLEGSPGALGLASESREVSVAFLAGALCSMNDDVGERLRARTLVVEDEAAWRIVVDQRTPAVLVPLFERRERVTAAVQRGHHVLIPLGRRDGGMRHVLTLNRQRRVALHKALADIPLAEDRVGALATLGRRSLTALRRRLAHIPTVHRPPWADAEDAARLIAPVLAGAWQVDQEADQQVLAHLAGRPYAEVEREVQRLAQLDDPPLRRTGPVWLLSSKEDAWQLISHAITRDDLTRLSDVILQVLGALDPSLDLPEDQRPLAGFLGKTLPHSGVLREELADTLALMAANSGEVPWNLPEDAQTFVDGVVRTLLSAKTTNAWVSMAWVLPQLAEASPEAFLSAVEGALTTNEPPLAELFQDQSERLFGPSSPHPSLLWALEGLAWSPRCLLRVARILAQLTHLDPGGKLGNRPGGSLRSILVGWSRNTSASAEDKLRALDVVRESAPDASWLLLNALLPTNHDSVSPTHKPAWRDWGQERELPPENVPTFFTGVTERLLSDARGQPDRAIALLEKYVMLTDDQRAMGRQILLDTAQAADTATAARVWEAVREFVAKQQEYRGAKWALVGDALQELEQLRDALTPDDLVYRHRYLFGTRVSLGLPHDDDHTGWFEKHQQLLTQLQSEAARRIFESEGVPGIQRLLDTLDGAQGAYAVGLALGRAEIVEFENPDTLRGFLQQGEGVASLVSGVLTALHARRGLDELERLLTSSEVRAWSPEMQALVLRVLPPNAHTWALVHGFGAAAEATYWQQLPSWAVPAESEADLWTAFARFRQHERPVVAFELARHHQLGLTGAQWLALLAELPRNGSGAVSNLAYEIKETLDELFERPDVPEDGLAQISWLYLPLYRFEQPPRALTRALLSEPALFAELVATAFPKPETAKTLDAEGRAQQERASSLLHSLRDLPGRSEVGATATALHTWVDTARSKLLELDCLAIGDDRIGTLLASGPTAPEGQWPVPAVCDVIEAVKSEALEDGFRVGRYNMRGVTSRDLDEGGAQERSLAQVYQQRAADLEVRWPRTASVLRTLGQAYGQEARREDDRADLTQDRWR